MDILKTFGIASRENESKLANILTRLESYLDDMEDIKDKLKYAIDSNEELDLKAVNALTSLYRQLNSSIETYGKYTGDLKTQNINMNVNLDYKDALFAYLGLVNEVLTTKQKKALLDSAREKGILFMRDSYIEKDSAIDVGGGDGDTV